MIKRDFRWRRSLFCQIDNSRWLLQTVHCFVRLWRYIAWIELLRWTIFNLFFRLFKLRSSRIDIKRIYLERLILEFDFGRVLHSFINDPSALRIVIFFNTFNRVWIKHLRNFTGSIVETWSVWLRINRSFNIFKYFDFFICNFFRKLKLIFEIWLTSRKILFRSYLCKFISFFIFFIDF